MDATAVNRRSFQVLPYFRTIGSLAAFALALWLESTAQGSSIDSEEVAPPSLEEVVVTATKQAADLQTVPLSITALSAQTLERADIFNFEDYAMKVPNLSYAPGFGLIDGRQIAIRGIQGLGTTGFYIDDLPIPATMNPRVLDLARVEVLRGPQGTLYGARSMGGTIRFITQEPDTTTFAGKIDASGSHVDGGGYSRQFDATVNLPLASQTAALRISAYGGADAGFINREFPDTTNPNALDRVTVGRNEQSGGSASLLWKPSDRLTIRAMAMTQRSIWDGYTLSDDTPDTLLQSRPFDVAEPAHDRWTYGGLSFKYRTDIGELSSASSWFSRQADETEDMSQYVGYAFGYTVPSVIYTSKPGHTFVEEMRFTSTFSGKWQFIGGLYFNRDSENYDQSWYAHGLNALYGGTLGTDLIYAAPGPGFTHEQAAFGELTYNIAPAWSATLAGRYSHITVSQYYYEDGLSPGGPFNGGGTTTERAFLPKAVVKFDIDSDTHLYALAAKGFRPGNGQVAPPPSACGDDYAASGLTQSQLSNYAADSVWNYEIGSKNRLLDGRMTIDAALFWIDWKNVQQQALFNCGYSYTVNAGAARSRGGEIEVAAAPLAGLSLNAGVGYTDAVITRSSATLQTAVGTPVQQVAPWTATASADYSVPVFGAVSGFVRADFSYTDHSFSANNDRVDLRLRQSYNITNIHIGTRAEHLDVSAFVSNVTNARANLGDDQSEGAELPGRPRWWVNPPRTVGAELTYRW